MPTLENLILSKIHNRVVSNTLRKLTQIDKVSSNKITINNHELANYSSNDYLGLVDNTALKSQSQLYIDIYGIGATASRLVSANLTVYENIETKIASLKGTQSALLLNSGFAGNLGVLEALGQNAVIVMDKLCHKSMIMAAQYTDFKRFKHNDLNDLEVKLSSLANSKLKDKPIIIVTESIFSMDGDIADLPGIIKLAQKYKATCYVDEAHATGIFGDKGKGLMEVTDNSQIVFGTFSKALGSFGAYIGCSTTMKEYLINYCSSLIYSTALPPAILGSMEAALDLLPTLTYERQHLANISTLLRNELNNLGFNTGNSTTQIIPLIFKSTDLTYKLSNYLLTNLIFAPIILPPTVQQPRIRLSLTAKHTISQIEYLIKVLKEFTNKYAIQ